VGTTRITNIRERVGDTENSLKQLRNQIATGSSDPELLHQIKSDLQQLHTELVGLSEEQLTTASSEAVENTIKEVKKARKTLNPDLAIEKQWASDTSPPRITFNAEGTPIIGIEPDIGEPFELTIEDFEGLSAKLSELNSKHEQLRAESQEFQKEIETLRENFSEVDDNLSNRLEEFEQQFDNISTQYASLQEKFSETEDEISTRLGEFEQRFDDMSSRIENDRETFQNELEELRTKRDELQEEIDEFQDRQDETAELQGEVENLKSEASDLLRETVSGELADEFESRKQDLKTTLRWWKGASVASIIILVVFSIWVYLDITATEAASYGMLSKVALILPVSVMVWFSVSNYSRQKRLMHEYEFRKNIAVSLPGFRERLEDLTTEENQDLVAEAILQTMNKIYSNPQDGVAENKGQQDGTPQVANEAGTVGSLLQRLNN
jgi:peptidoglycan hydrolase CwlO-like protein